MAAAEKLRVEQQEHDRQAAEEKARLEQAESRRVEEERSRAAKSSALRIGSPAFKKIALAVCGVVVLALLLYWATRPKPQPSVTQKPPVSTERVFVFPIHPAQSHPTSATRASQEKENRMLTVIHYQ